MILAKSGNFTLQQKTFLGRDKLTTHKLEICKIINNSTQTIAYIKNQFDLTSIDIRLIDAIETLEDLESIRILVKILYNNIRYTEDIECQ